MRLQSLSATIEGERGEGGDTRFAPSRNITPAMEESGRADEPPSLQAAPGPPGCLERPQNTPFHDLEIGNGDVMRQPSPSTPTRPGGTSGQERSFLSEDQVHPSPASVRSPAMIGRIPILDVQ